MKYSYLIFALASVLFLACQSVDPNEIIENTEGGSLSATINGEAFSVSGVQVSAEYAANTDMVQTMAVGGASLPLDGITRGLVLAIVSTDGTGIQAGDVYSGQSVVKVASCEWTLEEDMSEGVNAVSNITEVATIAITAIDYDNNLVSGTFSFDGVDKDATSTIYEVRDGKFTDVPFR